jgi:hypothetical protein
MAAMPTAFRTIDLPHCPPAAVDPARIRCDIDDWVRSDAIAALVTVFGGEPPTGSPDEAMAQLVAFSAVWDERRGLERSEIRSQAYAADIGQLVDRAMPALGLGGRTHPPSDGYDHVLVLGGGPRTALARPDHAARLLADGVRTRSIAALSSLRPLGESEVGFADGHGMPGLTVEAEAMAAGIAKTFGAPNGAGWRSGTTPSGAEWRTLCYQAGPHDIAVVAAPALDTARRANTGDAFVGWAELVHRPQPDERILVVTTDLFVPFQHADAVRCLGLPYRCGIDTVGLDAATYPQWVRQNTHTTLLQEVRSAVLALNNLAMACERS